jgi:hypothetical protein
MNPENYIISMMREITMHVEGISLLYAFEESTRFHVLEISPATKIQEDDIYIEYEARMWKEFYELFPGEDILISEPHRTNDMRDVICFMTNEISVSSFPGRETCFF